MKEWIWKVLYYLSNLFLISKYNILKSKILNNLIFYNINIKFFLLIIDYILFYYNLKNINFKKYYKYIKKWIKYFIILF